MNFASDNTSGICPEIMAALTAANEGAAMPYGNDDWTHCLEAALSDLFETAVTVFPVATGSAANALALSVLSPPFGAIYCHETAHIEADECGAPEFFTGGAKLVKLAGSQGKIRAADLARVLDSAPIGVVHSVQPAAVSITQATEAGTVYSLEEIAAIAQVAHAHSLPLHMDGARFANAMVRLGCSPAEATWKVGVDVLSFGATKNGAMAAEAVIFFGGDRVGSFAYRRKRGGHLFSKMRFLSVQLLAYVTEDLWLRNAAHANAMATKLAEGFATLPMTTLCYPVEANELFVQMPSDLVQALKAQGFEFYEWDEVGDRPGYVITRLVTAFNTAPHDVEAFLAAIQQFSSVSV